ncbi:zinc ribbon domain-containing protein [Stygiolobus caldivivus]|uniref:Zinc-ribbon domain-containing protein n=1 Tax=Stygiolobus caldivivus TaxID=2824673 RepID=A0A8D5U8S9_9CREN|nr:zinc ribbon domain-containing protein [Stygiolobus caldivivus]BCU71509.1 hypothetical protein KN1_28060 [Stygiolobus caldivivus]
MSNDFIHSAVCQPVGMAGKTIWLDVGRQLDMKRLSQDLKLLLRSEGMTVTSTVSPNILILQIHARGIRGHYYVVKICQTEGRVLIETGIISAKRQLEWAGVEGGMAGLSDALLHSKWLTLISGAFAGVDVATVLGSYEEENRILSQIEQVILSYQKGPIQAPPRPPMYQTVPTKPLNNQSLTPTNQLINTPRYCPNCGHPLAGVFNYCPNCGFKLR